MALASAPLGVSLNNQFFRPTANGRILFSARLFELCTCYHKSNNDAERSIRTFCIGKKNWQIIDSKRGAEASVMLYSIAETAKANGLKSYEYFQYVLDQMLLHLDDRPESYIQDLVPWSDKLPESCKKLKK